MLQNGEGKQATASDTTAEWIVSKGGADLISVKNKGSVEVFFLVNCTIAQFDALYALGKAIPVDAGDNFTFNAAGKQIIDRVCFRTASSTSAINFAAF